MTFIMLLFGIIPSFILNTNIVSGFTLVQQQQRQQQPLTSISSFLSPFRDTVSTSRSSHPIRFGMMSHINGSKSRFTQKRNSLTRLGEILQRPFNPTSLLSFPFHNNLVNNSPRLHASRFTLTTSTGSNKGTSTAAAAAFLGSLSTRKSFSSVKLCMSIDDEMDEVDEEEINIDDDDDDDNEEDDDEDDEDEYYEDDDEYDDDDNDLVEEGEEWEEEEERVRAYIQNLDQNSAILDNLDIDEIVENLTPEEKADIENDVEEMEKELVEPYLLSEDDLSDLSAEELEAYESGNPSAIQLEDDDDDDDNNEFPPDDDWIYGINSTLKQKDLVEFENIMKQFEYVKDQIEIEKNAPIANLDVIDEQYIMNNVLDEHTRNEIMNLDEEVSEDDNGELDQDELNMQRRQLIYDLNFNITNIFLASFKVNPDAPVILQNWMLQMRNWTRYEYVRLNDFNFTWDDVDNANTTELDQYWKGAGTDGTPKPTIRENPNIIEWDESPLTFEDEYLLALENWMEQVHHEEDDINLDDEDQMPDDNPASPKNGYLADDEVPPAMKDVEDFEEKYAHMSQEWRDEHVKQHDYEVVDRLESDFRGHLVIACSSSEEDLEMSEKLTLRMEKQFGDQVFVETRVIGHAKPEDYLYEIWLESWEIELLHSKRRAVFQRDWEGPREITDEYVEDLVKQVEFYISDDFRYSFILEEDLKA